MARFVLDNDFDYDLCLIGISSHARDYRMCWALNNQLKLQLAKARKGIQIPSRKQGENPEFPLFEYEDEHTRVMYSLIVNKNKNGYLIPEIKHADYLFMLRNHTHIPLTDLVEQVRLSDQVQAAFEVNAEELKSRDNLIYF